MSLKNDKQKVERRKCCVSSTKFCVTLKNLQTTMDIILLDFLILYQIFFSPQTRRNLIISNKHGMYELTRELSNDLRLAILQNLKT